MVTLRLQVSCTGLQNYTIGASLLSIQIRIPKSNIPLDYHTEPETKTNKKRK